MKSFRFTLEAVLEARRGQETEICQQLTAALERQRQAMARSRDAAQALHLIVQAIATDSAGRFSVADRDRSWAMRETQEKICAELGDTAQECTRLTEEKRAALLEARRNCDLLDRLKETKHRAWEMDAIRAEEHQLDEFAMTRHHQKSQQECSLC